MDGMTVRMVNGVPVFDLDETEQIPAWRTAHRRINVATSNLRQALCVNDAQALEYAKAAQESIGLAMTALKEAMSQ